MSRSGGGTGIEQFLGISQSGRLLGCGCGLMSGLGDEQMKKKGDMGRRSLEFQNFGNDKCDLLSSVQECRCQALCMSPCHVWWVQDSWNSGSEGLWAPQEGMNCPACTSVGPPNAAVWGNQCLLHTYRGDNFPKSPAHPMISGLLPPPASSAILRCILVPSGKCPWLQQ